MPAHDVIFRFSPLAYSEGGGVTACGALKPELGLSVLTESNPTHNISSVKSNS